MNLRTLLRKTRLSARPNRRRQIQSSQAQPVSQFERLENRALLAGNVTAQLLGQTAFVTGDSADNSVEIVVDGGNVVVRGLDNTTINGGTGDFVLTAGTAIPRNLRSFLGGGNDSLSVDGVTVGRDAVINAGSGNDSVTIMGSSVIGRNLKISGSSGDDTISVQDSAVTGTAHLKGGFGNDLLIMSNSSASNHLWINGGAGDDDVVIDDSLVGVDARIAGFGGNDDIVLRDSTVFGDLYVSGHSGDDIVMLDSSAVGDKSRIRGGGGSDNISFVGTTLFADRLRAFGGPGQDNIEAEATVVFDGFRNRSFASNVVDAAAISTRITDTTTGALAAAEAAVNGFDPRLTVSIDNSSVSETAGDAAATVTITRPDSTGDLEVTVASSNTSLVTVANGTVTIPDGQTSATVALNVINDGSNTADTLVTITASSANLLDSTVDITILNEAAESLTVSADVATIEEDTGTSTTTGTANSVTFTVTRTGDTTQAVSVGLSADATGVLDLPTTVIIPAGQTSATVAVETIVDQLVEADVNLLITAASPGLTSATTTLEVTDNDSDRLTVSFSAPTVDETGGSSSAVVIVERTSLTTDPLQVTLTSQFPDSLTFGGADSFIGTIPAGASQASFTINGVTEDIDDGDLSVAVTASATGFISGSGTIFATDDDDPTVTIEFPAATEFSEGDGAGAIAATVSRNTTDNTAAVVVNVATTGDDRISGPATVTIPAGQSSVNFTLDAVDNNTIDQPSTGTTTVSVSATNFTGSSAALTVTDDDVATISLSPSSFSVNETAGVGGATITVSRTDTSAAETIDISYSDTSLVTGPATVAFAAGETSQTLSLDVIDNNLFAANNSVLVTASGTGHPDVSASIGIINDEVLTVTSDTSANTTEQSVGVLVTKDSTFTVTGQTAPGATVQIDTDGNTLFDDGTTTANANGDYSLTVTLVNDDQNFGFNRLQVRSLIEAEGIDAFSPITDVHYSEGTVVRFEVNQDFDNDGNTDFFDVELLDTDAPITVTNFLSYTTSDATGDERFDNLLLQRSDDDFIVQAGRFNATAAGVSELDRDADNNGQNDTIQNEFLAANSNIRGTLSMALPANTPNGGSSEWFINTANNTFLDNALHTVFGRVIGFGMNVVDAANGLEPADLNGSVFGIPGALGEVPLADNVPYTEFSQQLAGTVSVQSGSTSLTGTGTQFLTELQVGNAILLAGQTDPVVVTSVVSDTQITIRSSTSSTYVGPTLSDVTGAINARPADENLVVFTNIGEILDQI